MADWKQVLVFLAACFVGALLITNKAEAKIRIPKQCEQYREMMTDIYEPQFAANRVAQTWAESACRAKAESAYAKGLMQFTPPTANDMCKWHSFLCPVKIFDPLWSITAGEAYMKRLYSRLKGNTECDRYAFAVAAYNSGLGWVLRDKKWAVRHGKSAFIWKGNVEDHPDPRRKKEFIHENRTYVKKILLKFSPVVIQQWGMAGLIC